MKHKKWMKIKHKHTEKTEKRNSPIRSLITDWKLHPEQSMECAVLFYSSAVGTNAFTHTKKILMKNSSFALISMRWTTLNVKYTIVWNFSTGCDTTIQSTPMLTCPIRVVLHFVCLVCCMFDLTFILWFLQAANRIKFYNLNIAFGTVIIIEFISTLLHN